jgi:hypothetical protein
MSELKLMAEEQTTSRPASPHQPGARVQLAGIIILAVGLVTAGLVYGLSKPAEDLPDELGKPENFKRSARDLASNFGQMGVFSYDLGQELQDPAIQAAIIASVAILISGGCFYIAHLQRRDPEARRCST